MYVLVTTFIALSVGLSKVIRSHVIHEQLLIGKSSLHEQKL